MKTVNARRARTAGPAGGFLRAKTEKLKKVLRSILTEYPAGVYNQDTPMGYLKERGDRHGRMLLPEDQGPHGRGLHAFCKELLADHIRTCVAENIRAGNDEVIDELVRTMQKLMK